MTLAPEGRKLLRVEQRNKAVPVERKPEWIKANIAEGIQNSGTTRQEARPLLAHHATA